MNYGSLVKKNGMTCWIMVSYCIFILLSFLKTLSISMSKRFELALYAFIANGAPSNSEHSSQHSCFERGTSFPTDSVVSSKGKNVVDEFSFRSLDRKLGRLDLEDDLRDASGDLSVPLAEGVTDFQKGVFGSNLVFQQSANSQTSFVDKTEGSGVTTKGPSQEAYHLSNDSWLSAQILDIVLSRV